MSTTDETEIGVCVHCGETAVQTEDGIWVHLVEDFRHLVRLEEKPADEDDEDPEPPVAVVDMDSATQPGEQFTVVHRCHSEQEAVVWLSQHEDQEKVERGGFGVDAPEPCCYVAYQTRGSQHHVTCEEYR